MRGCIDSFKRSAVGGAASGTRTGRERRERRERGERVERREGQPEKRERKKRRPGVRYRSELLASASAALPPGR